MTSANEVPRIHRWLRTVLGADSTLSSAVGGRFYQGFVPEGKALPACVFSVLAFLDDKSPAGPYRLWSKAIVLVKIVAETNTDAAIQTAADRIDAVLHGIRGATADMEIDYCDRKRPFYMKDTSVADKTFIHLGGEYELAARYTG